VNAAVVPSLSLPERSQEDRLDWHVSPSKSDVSDFDHLKAERPFVILGGRGDPRVQAFGDALARAGLAPAHLIDYRDVCTSPSRFAAKLPAGALLRIESPGRDPVVTQALLAAGIASCRARGEPFIAAETVPLQEKGRIVEPRQAFRGLGAVLDHVSAALAGRPDVTSLLDPDLIMLAFDKRQCHAALSSAGISVPRALPPPASFDDLIEQMRKARLPRVFVKLRHGSAASGMAALATSSRGFAAWTTAELVTAPDGVKLFNTRAVRRIEGAASVRALIDALIPLGVHVEAWVPKAGIDGAVCDLRVLVIGGEPAHMVLRKSRTPFTNLHLGNRRAPAAELEARMGEAAWSDLVETCRRAGRRFARSFHVALDVAVATDLRRHYVLEVNAFGDLLRGVDVHGLDPYDVEIARLPQWLARRTLCSM
jgi:hypothetical protein